MGCGCSRALDDVDSSHHAPSVIITAGHSPRAAHGPSPPASPVHVSSGKPPLSPQQVLVAAQQCIAEEPHYQAARLAPVTLAALALIQSGGRTDAKHYREDLGDVCHGLGQLTLSTARFLAQEGGAQRYGRHPSIALLEQPGPALYYTAAYLCWMSAEAGHSCGSGDSQQQQQQQQPSLEHAQQDAAAATELAAVEPAAQACQAHMSCSSSVAHSRSSSSSCGGRGGGGSVLSPEALEEWRVKAYLQGPKGVSHAAAALFWLKFTKARAALEQLQAAVAALQAKQQQRLEREQRRRQRRTPHMLQRHGQQLPAAGVDPAAASGMGAAAGGVPQLAAAAAAGGGVVCRESSDSSGGSSFCTMHVLQPGEDLAQVAAVVGSSVEAILAANPEISCLEDLQPHDCIALPVPLVLPRLYVLQPGDTLRSVAKAHSTTVGRLVSKNPELLDAGRVQPGWVVSIPGLKGDSRAALDLSESIEAAARAEREARELEATAWARSPISGSPWGWHSHSSAHHDDRVDQDAARTGLSWGRGAPGPAFSYGATAGAARGTGGTSISAFNSMQGKPKADQGQAMPQGEQRHKSKCRVVGAGSEHLQPYAHLDALPRSEPLHRHHHGRHHHHHHISQEDGEQQQQSQQQLQQNMLHNAHSPPVSAVVTSLVPGSSRRVTAV